MRVIVRGWSRDHGEKEIINTEQLEDMPVAPLDIGLKQGETYLQVVRRTNPYGGDSSFSPTIHLWADAKLNLNGWYQTHFEIHRGEIGRLFYLAYGHRELGDIGRVLASFKGPNGGYRLSRPASAVSMLEIVEAVDGPIRGQSPLSEEESDSALNRASETAIPACDSLSEDYRVAPIQLGLGNSHRKFRASHILEGRAGKHVPA